MRMILSQYHGNMNSKFKYILFLFIIINSSFLSAQDVDRNVGLYGIFKFQNAIHHSVQQQRMLNFQLMRFYDSPNTMGSGGLSAEIGYFIIPKKLSVGFVLGYTDYAYHGLENWTNLLDLKYFLLEDRNSPFVYGQFGRVSGAINDNLKGTLLGFGVGQKLFFTKKLATVLSISYQLTRMSLSEEKFRYSDQYVRVKGIEFGIGLYF